MPEISTKTAVREIPKTTVEDAITRGRRKVQEARSLREMREAARAAQQSAVPVSGMEQGDTDAGKKTERSRMGRQKEKNPRKTAKSPDIKTGNRGKGRKKQKTAPQRKKKQTAIA